MPLMRAVQVKNANGPFELVEREVPSPIAGEVLIKVQACGVCHSDAFTKMGFSQASIIHACRATKLWGLSTRSASVCPIGGRGNVSASAGTVVIAVIAPPVAAAISLPVRTGRFRH